MKYLFLLLLFVPAIADAQSISNNAFTDSLSKNKTERVNQFLALSPSDIIADIGTGSGYSLIPIANNCPACRFTVEDIDSTTCNPRNLLKRINKTGNKTSLENFSFQYGTEKATQLPANRFTKILLFDVLHEMTYKSEMLGDIKRIAQKSASIFIEEILVHTPVKKDRTCNYPFLTEAEFKKILSDNGLKIIREAITSDSGKNKYFKIFECVFM